MKILFITHYSLLYGANRSMLLLLDGLSKHDVQPMVVISEEGDLSAELEKRGIPFIILKFYWWCGEETIRPKNFLKRKIFEQKKWLAKRSYKNHNIAQLAKLKKRLADFIPDYVYSNSSVFNFGNLFAQKYHIPHIWHLRETQEQYNLHWWYPVKLINRSFQQSEIVIGVSEFIKQNYKRKHGIDNIEVLYNPIITRQSLFELDQKRKEVKSEIRNNLVYGIIGVLHPNKGQEEAIKAFALVQKKYPDTKLIIVGFGDQSKLKLIAKKLGVINHTEFWGHLEDPFKAFLHIDVSLMCSRMEGMGRVTLESMAAAVPVIGYKEGGTMELIDDNYNGLLYEKGFRDLATKMIFMIENDADRKRMGENARESFESKYTSEVYTENFLKILNNSE